MEKMDIKSRIVKAIQAKDIELLKQLKEEVNQQQWLDACAESGKGLMAFLEPNPFIKWKD